MDAYLLYCVTDLRVVPVAEREPAWSHLGLYQLWYREALLPNQSDAPVAVAVEGDLGCALGWLGSDPRPQPQDFYDIVSSVLDEAPALPFRFPTIVQGSELGSIVLPVRALLRDNAATFTAQLAQFHHALEIDLRILDVQELTAPASGTAYLEAARDRSRRMLETATELRSYMRGLFEDWKSRDTRDEVRCSALVRRDGVAAFNERIAGYENTRGAKIIVSRPWAPTAFMNVPELTFPSENR